MSAPLRPRPTVTPGDLEHHLIRGVLRVDVEPANAARIELLRMPEWTLSLVDTGDGGERTSDSDVTIHILWQMNEDGAAIEVAGEKFLIAPGDTMTIPAGKPFRTSAGMLLIEIETRSPVLDTMLLPNHGVESFEGYNRRTTYDTPGAFSLERWKITQPLTLPASEHDYAVVDLVTPLALSWWGGTDLIGRGECRVISRETGPVTLLPDGLGYALIVR
jgi:hypothetical protein